MAIQFEYCFPIIGLCIYIYEFVMLSMGFHCFLEERVSYPIRAASFFFNSTVSYTYTWRIAKLLVPAFFNLNTPLLNQC